MTMKHIGQGNIIKPTGYITLTPVFTVPHSDVDKDRKKMMTKTDMVKHACNHLES
jgi:hypothetical protein